MSDMKNTVSATGQRRLRERSVFGIGIWQMLGHLVGVAVVSGLVAFPFFTADILQQMWDVSSFSGFGFLIGKEGALHIAISACLWILLVLLVQLMRPDSAAKASRRFRATRGSVMTETLIVMPVALLLTFGLAQLAVMNIAGILANLASVQAGRTVWLWQPESASSRQNVTEALVQDLARIQAAVVMAPAAPGDFKLTGSEGSPLFKQMRGSLIGAQVSAPSRDAGNQGMIQAVQLAKASGDVGPDRAFHRALDGGTFIKRTARKVTFAYLATTVEVINSGEQVGARITYRQLCAFPVVSMIFGESGTVGPRNGRYAEIKREFTLHKQLDSNENKPRQ